MKTLSRIMLAAAATSFAVLPVAAEAGTRAGSNSTLYSVSAPGKGRAAKGQRQAEEGVPFFLIGLGTVVIIAGVITIVNSDGPASKGQSPGT